MPSFPTSFKFLFSVLLFVISGISSAYMYSYFKGYGGGYFPGLIYTSSTVVVLILFRADFKIKNLLIYYALMNITYILIFYITLVSSWFAFLTGIITAGIGAVTTLVLADKYIIDLDLRKNSAFILGGLSFLITDIIGWVFEKNLSEYLLNITGSLDTPFIDIFMFWQLIVGTFFTLQISKAVEQKS